MRQLSALFVVIFATVASSAPASRAAFPHLKVRLLTPLTSYDSEPGSEFQSVVIAPYIVEDRMLLPPGTLVLGTVQQTKEVGIGIVRERASIRLAFHHYQLSDGTSYALKGVLRRIDNARETVTEDGQIRGILAANNPQSFLHGIWHRPRLGHLSRSFVGLTGAGGKIFSAYSMGPIGGAGLFAARLAMFRLPEPEIQLPAGTEMSVAIKRLPSDAPSVAPPERKSLPFDLATWLAEQRVQVAKPGGEPAEDIINVAFEGSKEDLNAAFRLAGWFKADPLTTRTFARAYQSYTKQKGYPQAPVSKLLYRGDEPDAVYQKSLNTIAKRHHIRLWRVEKDEREFWLGAATHDIGVALKKRSMSFTHKIDPRIDLERSKVIHDLEFTGCAEIAMPVPRQRAVLKDAGEGGIVTDGDLAFITVRRCEPPPNDVEPIEPTPPQSRLARVGRRMILEGRQYALRGNAYYWAYRAITFRRHAAEELRASLED